MLVAGAWLQEYARWLPRRPLPPWLRDNPFVYVIDERWDTFDIPLQDVRGSLRAVPVQLDAVCSEAL